MPVKKIILVALFASLTAVGAFVKIPFLYAAITLQLLFTLTAGIVLGPWYGALSQLIYVLLGLAGLPIFAKGGGLWYMFEPTFGFVAALPLAAMVSGLISRRGGFRWTFAGVVAGSLTVYAVGVPYLWAIVNFYIGKEMGAGAALTSGMLLYLPGDAMKCLAAAAVSERLKKSSLVILRGK